MTLSGTTHDEGVTEVVKRFVADGRAFVTAEVNLYKQIATGRLEQAKRAVAFGVVGLLLTIASVVTLLVGLAVWLSHWLGMLGATLLVTVTGLGLAGLLFWLAAKSFSPGVSK